MSIHAYNGISFVSELDWSLHYFPHNYIMFQGRVRILALIVKLFSISSSVASVVYNSNLLSLLVEEALTGNDMLKTLSVIELLYEVWQ